MRWSQSHPQTRNRNQTLQCGRVLYKMTVFNLYIFDRNCTCLYYRQWSKCKNTGISQEEERKLMYGMVYSLKSLISRLSPTSTKDGFLSYSTDKYKLHFFETPTGVKFILNTGNKVGDCRDVLQHIYAKFYVDLVIKNPLYKLGEWIESELFTKELDSYIQSRPFYSK